MPDPGVPLQTLAVPGATVEAPEGWQVLLSPGVDVELVALEPDDDGFRANLVLTRTGVNGMSFRDWQVGTDEMLPSVLRDYLLLDLERLEVAGHPGGRRLAHQTSPDGEALVVEQWFTLVDDIGWTLSATVDTARHDLTADLFARCAATFQLSGAAR